jgi:NADH-quinone oxidoreductase subunit E
VTEGEQRVDRGRRGIQDDQPEVPAAAPTNDERAAVDRVLEAFPAFRRDMLLTVLHAVRAELPWFSLELTRYLSQRLVIPFADLYGVISFYGLFKVKPAGRTVIRACKGLPCYLHGASQIGAHLQMLLERGPGEPSADGRMSWEWFDCLGQCDFAPALLVGDEAMRDATPESVQLMVERICRD